VGGQALDLSAGSGAGVEAVREIHRCKTAALVAAAAELGALAADAPGSGREALRGYGLALGLCFQAVDDVLDVVGDAASLGKTPGKDAAAEKATLVDALGLEGARAEAQRRAEQARECARAVGTGEGGLLMQLVDHFLARTT
jgi:farnesyl diphosphate synthase